MELLGRLRRAVLKLTFLLNPKNYLILTQSTLRFATFIRARAPAAIVGPSWGRRAISFNDSPGLRACVEGDEPENDASDEESRSEVLWGESSSFTLRSSTSYRQEDDVDKKAYKFIDNFYRHLVFEKQVSLDLRYTQDDSSSSSRTYSFGDSLVSSSSSPTSQLVSPR